MMLAKRFVVFLLVFSVMASVVGCPAVGISDPDTRIAAYRVVNVLDMIESNAHDSTVVGQLCGLALERVAEFDLAKLTDLDRVKVTRLRDGIRAIYESRESPDYVVLRAYTLRELAASIGLYEQEGLKEAIDMITPQTQPNGQDPEEAPDGSGD